MLSGNWHLARGKGASCYLVSIRGISDDPNGSLVSNVVAMAAPRRAAARCESGESQFFIVWSTISSESGFPATQSNGLTVKSHNWPNHTIGANTRESPGLHSKVMGGFTCSYSVTVPLLLLTFRRGPTKGRHAFYKYVLVQSQYYLGILLVQYMYCTVLYSTVQYELAACGRSVGRCRQAPKCSQFGAPCH